MKTETLETRAPRALQGMPGAAGDVGYAGACRERVGQAGGERKVVADQHPVKDAPAHRVQVSVNSGLNAA